MKKWKKDVLCGLILLIVSGWMINDLSKMNEVVIPYKNAEAGVYSRVWLFLLMALSVIMIVRAVITRNEGKTEQIVNATSVVTIALLAGYFLLMKPIGYVLSTLLFLTALMSFYGFQAGRFQHADGTAGKIGTLLKKVGINIGVSAIIAGVTYILFTRMVGVMLPQFPW